MVGLTCLPPLIASAQQNDIPLNRDIYYDIDRNGAKHGSTMHTGLRPILESRADLDNVMGYRADSTRAYYWITERLLKEHFFVVKDGGFHLTIDPAFQFEVGKEFREETDYAEGTAFSHNGRGFRIAGDLGPTVSFQTSFYENQATLSRYLYSYAQATGVVPGQGRIKDFNQRGLDFAWAMGNVSWAPRTWINVQLGQGRHFVGNGYRSVLLSDNTFCYPYVKVSAITTNKRFQYTTIHAKLQMIGEANRLPTGDAGESLFYWKHATFQHLSANLGPVQLGLFEATLWNNIDSAGVRAYNAMQLNPVIGLNTAVNGFKGIHTQLLGLDAKVRLTDKTFIYGQFALTDPERSRYAYRAGMQWFDLFRRDLHLLVEYNSATPFAYTRANERMSYTHFNQPLGDPLGTGFNEVVAIVDYGIKQKFWFRAMVGVADLVGDSTATTVSGGDIFGPDVAVGGGPGKMDVRRLYADLSAAWRMNQMSNMQVIMGWRWRDIDPAPVGAQSGYLYLTFRTALFNRYYDI